VTATVRKLKATEVQLDIEVTASDLTEARERAFRKLVKQHKIPGFRQGHAPRRIFEQHVGSERIDHQAMEDVVPEAYTKALKEHNLEPVDRPKIDLERIDEGKALRITATVAVRPEIELKEYRGISVSRPPVHVSDEDVEHSLQSLRKRAATLEPVTDRGIQAGDVVTLDYEGTIDGRPFEGGTARDHTTEVLPEKFIPGFAEQLFDAKAGDTRTVRVTFPPAYHATAVAGKEAVFEVAIHDVKTPVQPPLDDEFAKQISEHQSLDALRDDVRRRHQILAESRAREAMERELLAALVARHDFPLPEVLVEREAANMLADAKDSVEQSGRTWDAYLRSRNAPESAILEEINADAQRRVKAALLIEQIAKTEKIEATTADLEREIERLARSTGRTRQAAVEMLQRSGDLGRLMDAIRRDKTMAFLVEKASVTEKAPEVTAGQSAAVE
jgi:trigger factor